MALSIHWEWRGFGAVSDRFRRRFDRLASVFGSEPQRIVDEYLWIPDVHVNLKFRQGTGWQDGLKFKRLAETREAFERWNESIAEVFPFPLSRQAWQLLLAEMKADGHRPPRNAGRDEAVRFLQSIDPRIRTVVVRKERQSHRWGSLGEVRIELAEISSPLPMTSVGLEAEAISHLQDAIDGLRLHDERLEEMNYLDYMKRCAGK